MIFLDYEMPICDGRRVLELLREEEGTKGTWVGVVHRSGSFLVSV